MPAISEKAAMQAQTILVVDDSAVVRDVTRKMLESVGYRVLSAPNGPDAMRLSQQHIGPIDLLLTDVVMPGMSGQDLASAVAAARPDTKILFMSGIVTAKDLDEGRPFLPKPYGHVDLLRKVEGVLVSRN
ncbi:MAG: response regulator [Actinobacteria bacterium]|nr:response regulator [Actinomycetota bacterium]